ncbi:hypothetical protein WJX73_004410 [Symbiochloris irregularis]|uniref:Uncharacterized protein n=1 Tax=Symbiochloris irregularis TaxID=706552 RepID=A0AAW1P4C5_9CHLO
MIFRSRKAESVRSQPIATLRPKQAEQSESAVEEQAPDLSPTSKSGAGLRSIREDGILHEQHSTRRSPDSGQDAHSSFSLSNSLDTSSLAGEGVPSSKPPSLDRHTPSTSEAQTDHLYWMAALESLGNEEAARQSASTLAPRPGFDQASAVGPAPDAVSRHKDRHKKPSPAAVCAPMAEVPGQQAHPRQSPAIAWGLSQAQDGASEPSNSWPSNSPLRQGAERGPDDTAAAHAGPAAAEFSTGPTSRENATGDFTFANGDCYCGGVMHGMPRGVPHGTGLYRYSNGGCYAGQWHRGHFCGHGIQVFPGGTVSIGSYQHGTAHGLAMCLYTDGAVFEGEFQAGWPHGRGMHKGADGSIYVGTYKQGRRHGRGGCLFANGDRYWGTWVEDQPTGLGSYCSALGQVFQGEFSEGSKDGWGMSISAGGHCFGGRWSEGAPMWYEACSREDAQVARGQLSRPLRQKRMIIALAAAKQARQAAIESVQLSAAHSHNVRSPLKAIVRHSKEASEAAEEVTCALRPKMMSPRLHADSAAPLSPTHRRPGAQQYPWPRPSRAVFRAWQCLASEPAAMHRAPASVAGGSSKSSHRDQGSDHRGC